MGETLVKGLGCTVTSWPQLPRLVYLSGTSCMAEVSTHFIHSTLLVHSVYDQSLLVDYCVGGGGGGEV